MSSDDKLEQNIEASRRRIREYAAMGETEVRKLTTSHINPKFIESLSLFDYIRHFRRAKGMHLWDEAGSQFIDMLGCYGAAPLGHNHPEVRAAIIEALGAELPHFILVAPEALPAALAARLATIMPGDLSISFFSSSGSEAVDGALKLARAATKRHRFVYAENAYHGTTFGALSVTGDVKHRQCFEPLLAGSTAVPWGNTRAIERQLVKRDVAAVILEPVQAEGGINLPPPGYLTQVSKLCERYGTLFIADEVQTGLGRTGAMFACEHEGVVPDIMVLAKALSGGLVPISSYTTRPKVWQRAYGDIEKHEIHCTTFRGGPLACAAALTTLDVIEREGLAEAAAEQGRYLGEQLRQVTAGHSLVREVRGSGLLWGLELRTPKHGLTASFVAQWLVVGLLERGVITQVGSLAPNVVRFEPPLIVEREHIDQTIEALRETLSEHSTSTLFSMAKATKRLVLNQARAWSAKKLSAGKQDRGEA